MYPFHAPFSRSSFVRRRRISNLLNYTRYTEPTTHPRTFYLGDLCEKIDLEAPPLPPRFARARARVINRH